MAKKVKSKKVAVPRKRKPLSDPVFNCMNPDVAEKVELAFKCGNVEYYRFIDDSQMPVGRYKYIYEALKEADMRMTRETLLNYIKIMKEELDGGRSKGMVSMGNIWKTIINMESRVVLAFEPASIERLAAVLYFTKSEDLKTYDRKLGAAKIENWNKHDYVGFFLTKPIVELFGLRGISEPSLRDYLTETVPLIQDLTADMSIPSEANTSGSGKNS